MHIQSRSDFLPKSGYGLFFCADLFWFTFGYGYTRPLGPDLAFRVRNIKWRHCCKKLCQSLMILQTTFKVTKVAIFWLLMFLQTTFCKHFKVTIIAISSCLTLQLWCFLKPLFISDLKSQTLHSILLVIKNVIKVIGRLKQRILRRL